MSVWIPIVALAVIWFFWWLSRPMVYQGVLWGEMGDHLPNLVRGGRGTRIELEAGESKLALERGRGSPRHVLLRLKGAWAHPDRVVQRIREQGLRCTRTAGGTLRVAVRRADVVQGWNRAIRIALEELGVLPGTDMRLTYRVVKRSRVASAEFRARYEALAARGDDSWAAKFGKAGLNRIQREERETPKYDR